MTLRLALLVSTSLLACLSVAQSLEHKVKAAFLYNFAKYIDWPASSLGSSDKFVIGIVGRDTLGGVLETTVEGKTIGDRTVVVKHFRWDQDLSKCQILFVPSSDSANYGKLEALRRLPVLTVGESNGFAQNFGVVNFVIDSGKVGFEINPKRGQAAGLTISSKLLRLAKGADHS